MECRVCSAEAPGFLYKISSCRACAAFFKRTVQMKLFYSCKKDKDCSLDHKQQFCRHCRMKKCLTAGMVTDGSDFLTDYYLKEISPAVATRSSQDAESSSDEEELPNLAACFSDHEQFEASVKRKIATILKKGHKPSEQPFKLNLCQQSARAYELFQSKYDHAKKEGPKNIAKTVFSVEDMERFLSEVFVIFIRIAEFYMDIEPFAKLPLSEKVAIYKKKGQSFCDIAFVAHTVKVLGRNLNDSKWAFFDGQVFDVMSSTFNLSLICNKEETNVKDLMNSSYLDIDRIFHRPFKIINPDNFEVQYLFMKSLWNLEGIDGLSTETLRLGERIQSQLDEELSYYYNYDKGLQNVASRIYKIHNLITAVERVVELRENEKQLWKTFDMFKFDLWIDDLPV